MASAFVMGNVLPLPENQQQNTPPPENNPPSPSSSPTPETQTCPTCEICIETMELQVQKSKFLKDCDHPFCSDCMIKYICAKLDDNISKIPCPALNCNQFLDPFTCQTLIAPQVFVRWCDALCQSSVMELERSYCPNRNCSALIVSECGRPPDKKATCPNCKRPFCFRCMLPWHGVLGCEESREFRGRDDLEFGILAKNKMWMRCPRCRHFVERVNGCRIIRCRCQAMFCYDCGAECNAFRCRCQGYRGCICPWLLMISIFLAFAYVIFTFASAIGEKSG